MDLAACHPMLLLRTGILSNLRLSKGSCSGIQTSKQKKSTIYIWSFLTFWDKFCHSEPVEPWGYLPCKTYVDLLCTRILLDSNKQTIKNENLESQFMNNFRQNLPQWARGALRTLTVRNLRGPRGLSSEVTSPYGDLVGSEAVRGSWGFSEEKRPHFSPSVADKLWLCEGLFL